jgi:Cu-processing system ATP-binding protein
MASTSPAPDGCAISLSGVAKHYGAVRAVDGVDLQVQRGELFGLIGHNGAGKSTLFKMMLGLISASAGEITVAGASVRARAFRAARRQIGYLPENLVLYDNLSGLETLRFFARLKRVDLAECTPMLARVGLQDAGSKPVRAYSKGMRQRLGFAQALLGAPRVLFLDEPTNGLDPMAIREMYALLHERRAEGTTIVITSHVLAELQERVDRLAILANGRVQALGSVQQLREQQRLPLTIALDVAPAAQPALREHLRTLQVLSLRADGDEVLIECRREDKLALLAALSALPLRDLQIREPSLEDLFFDLRSAA